MSLKRAFSKSFPKKVMGLARQILGMHIVRDRTKNLLSLSQVKYVTKVLHRFNMQMKVGRFDISDKYQCPKSERDKVEMRKIPYASVVGSLMYAKVLAYRTLRMVSEWLVVT